MNYRSLGKSDIKVSEIGLGCEHLQGKDYDTVNDVISAAIDCGINIFDVFMSEPEVRSNIGRSLAGRRDKVVIQGHIGAGWIDGQYCRTRDPLQYPVFFEDLLTRLQTDYIDIGMIHYVDTEADCNAVFNGEIVNYAKQLKQEGKIKLIGISTHDPVTATKAATCGFIDVIMFSLNPAYDLLPEDATIDDIFSPDTFKKPLLGANPVREELYKLCEANGVAITVMKTLGAGTLLNEKSSPFSVALTSYQCMNYALGRPGVASVLIGMQTVEEVYHAVEFDKIPDEQKDYSVILAGTTAYSAKGRCMYCNHCLPCPSQIDIAKVNKLLDLALVSEVVPESVSNHYKLLPNKAGDCIECGSCESNCPFAVRIIERMKQAVEVFGG